MDKNGRLFKKVSIVDLVVVIVLAVLIGGTVYRFTSPDTNINTGDVTINFTLRADWSRPFVLENYYEGLRVYNRMTNQFIGNIIDVWYEQTYSTGVNNDGEIVYIPRADLIDVFFKVQSVGRVTNYAVFAEGTQEINVGSTMQIDTKYVRLAGARVHDVQVMD